MANRRPYDLRGADAGIVRCVVRRRTRRAIANRATASGLRRSIRRLACEFRTVYRTSYSTNPGSTLESSLTNGISRCVGTRLVERDAALPCCCLRGLPLVPVHAACPAATAVDSPEHLVYFAGRRVCCHMLQHFHPSILCRCLGSFGGDATGGVGGSSRCAQRMDFASVSDDDRSVLRSGCSAESSAGHCCPCGGMVRNRRTDIPSSRRSRCDGLKEKARPKSRPMYFISAYLTRFLADSNA